MNENSRLNIFDKIIKAIVIVIAVTLAATMIYLLIGFNMDTGIVNTYNNLSGKTLDSKTNFNRRIYKIVNDNGTYSVDVSINNNIDEVSMAGSSFISSEESEWTREYWEDRLSNYALSGDDITKGIIATNEFYFTINDVKNRSGFNIEYVGSDYNGRCYINEIQTTDTNRGAVWDLYIPSSTSMGQSGCGFFAISALASNKSGRLITVREVLESIGEELSLNANRYVAKDGDPILPSLTLDFDTMTKAFQNLLSNKSISTHAYPSNKSMPQECINKLIAGEACYIIHAASDAGDPNSPGSSTKLYSKNRYGTGQHWTALIGAYEQNGTRYVIVLCNGNRGISIPESEFTQSPLSQCYEVVIK